MVSARTQEIIGSVKSDKGFYIGDICYVLDDEVYRGLWGQEHHFDDGCFEVPGTGYSFAVGSTAYGDACYCDEHGNRYGVDAGVIGIVPLELCSTKGGTSLGSVFENPGEARFEMFEGRFKFDLPGMNVVNINTGDDDDDEEEEEYGYWADEEDDDDSGEGWD